MQGVILAAGQGSRLQPITLTRSKAMVPILGKPIVERAMEDLVANGVNDFILVVSPDDRYITRYFGRESKLEADVRFAYQAQRLGMANALECAAPLITDDFILSACDNLISAEHVGWMMELWRTSPRPNAVLTLMPVEPGRLGSVGIVELATGEYHRLAETRAFNLQQGAMLHWLPSAPDRAITYNDRQGDRHVAIVLDIHTGRVRVLPRPIAGISPDGRTAASLNYARLRSLRPVREIDLCHSRAPANKPAACNLPLGKGKWWSVVGVVPLAACTENPFFSR